MLPRTVFGSNGSTQGSMRRIAAAPTASAVRMSVPRFPGSCRRSRTITNSCPVGFSESSDASGMRKVATMPCGSSRSDNVSMTRGDTPNSAASVCRKRSSNAGVSAPANCSAQWKNLMRIAAAILRHVE